MTPDSMLVDPNSQYVYITGTNPTQILAYQISNTGALVERADLKTLLAYNPLDIAIAPSGSYAYVTSANESSPGGVYQYSRNSNDGALTALDPESVTAGAAPIGLVLSPSGNNAYVANFESNTISQYSIDASNGKLAPIEDSNPTVISESGPYSITVTPSGKYLYVTNESNSKISMYSIGSENGKLSDQTAILTGSNPYGIFAW